MMSMRTFRRLEMIKMLSIKRFQKLLAGYFISATIVVILYMCFHGNDESQTTRGDDAVFRDVDDAPFIIEVNGSVDDSPDEDELLGKIEQSLRAIASQNAVRPDKQEIVEFNQKLPSDEELRHLIDALQYAQPTRAEGLDDVTSAMSTVYSVEPISNTDDYDPDEQKEARKVTPDPGVVAHSPDGAAAGADMGLPENRDHHGADVANESEMKYYDLDKQGAVYDDIMPDYEDDDNYEIPHILHQTWDTTDIPVEVSSWVPSWIQYNPFWVHWFWTDPGFIDMMLRHFPEYYDIYRKYDHKVNKADMRKYFLLYREGGVVADLDLECVRPFDDAIMGGQCILAQEPYVHQALLYGAQGFEYVTPAFMACRAGHPFFKFVIDSLRPYAERSHALEWDDQVLNSTGTMFLSQVYHDYKRQFGGSDVFVAPAELFMPAYDSSLETKLRVKCNGYKLDDALTYGQKKVCEGLTQTNFANFRTENSYTYHHWSKTWTKYHAEENMENIKNIVPGITIFDR